MKKTWAVLSEILNRNQARVQELVRGGAQNIKAFFFRFSIFKYFRGGGAAQKVAEKMIFLTKKVAKYG